MKTEPKLLDRYQRFQVTLRSLPHALRRIGWMVGLCLPLIAAADPSHETLIALIDVDGNGTADFELRGGRVVNSQCSSFDPGFIVNGYGLIARNGNQILRSDKGCYPEVAILAEGSLPQSSPDAPSNWGVMGELLINDFHGLFGPYYFGPLHRATSAYAAVRFSSPAGLHYGWIELTNAAPDTMPSVARFAAEPRVNTPLQIGRTIENTGSTNSSPIRVAGSATILGGVVTKVTTNSASGDITRMMLLEVAPDLTCLVRPDAEVGTLPVPLEERRLLSVSSPSDAVWTVPSGPLRLLEQVESAGGVVRASGPLAGRSAVLLGLGNQQGDHWWIEILSTGESRFVGHSHTNQGPLVVGQPAMNSQWPASAIDLDGDHRMDFSYQPVGVGTASPEHWLHPFRNNRILVPLLVPRGGAIVGPTPEAGSWWTNSPVALWKRGGAPDQIVAGTNGFVAVEFVSGTGTRYGWIQFNYYRKIHGVIGFETIFSSFFDFIDYGAHPISGEPGLVGSGSAAPELAIRDGKAHLTWNPLRSGSSLEWSGTLTTDGWTLLTGGGQSSYSMPLPKGTNAAFFRLRAPTPKPPVI